MTTPAEVAREIMSADPFADYHWLWQIACDFIDETGNAEKFVEYLRAVQEEGEG